MKNTYNFFMKKRLSTFLKNILYKSFFEKKII